MLFCLATEWSGILHAQSGFTSVGGANFLGYGRAGVTIGGVASAYFNQAGLTEVNDFAVDLIAEKRFNLEELSTFSLAIAKSLKAGTFSFMISSFGFTEYNEQKMGLGYARKLSENISLGGQLDLLRINIAQFGNGNYFTFELGLNYKINNEFSIGTHIFNPGRVTIAENTLLGTRFRMGLKYTPSAKVFLITEVDKLIDRNITEFKFGISYQMAQEVQLRFGANPSVSIFSFGVALSMNKKYGVAAAYGLNNVIGNTPAVSFQYSNK